MQHITFYNVLYLSTPNFPPLFLSFYIKPKNQSFVKAVLFVSLYVSVKVRILKKCLEVKVKEYNNDIKVKEAGRFFYKLMVDNLILDHFGSHMHVIRN
jgi:hypothetical protein